ncbi:MAG: S8 family serine peptidase [Acidobacteria bacterium]|nr:S8 family serine peptidase [Acidobacteriota bacterium]
MRLSRVAVLFVAAAPAALPAPSSLRADAAPRVAPLRVAAQSRPPYRPGEVIVRFETATDLSVAERAIRDVGGVAARRSAFAGHYLVTLAPGVGVPEAVARFRALREVDYAEPNGTLRAFFEPNDTFFRHQWNFTLLNVRRMWDIQKGDASVVVAVVDTGIAYENFGPFRKAPDWGATRFVRGFNALTGTEHANDDNFHGTHVASTIAEGTNNGLGVAGLAFNCALMPVKVLDDEGFGSFFDVAEGVDFATENGAKVVNLSLGGDATSETLRRAIDRAVTAGVVVVAAAGNDGVGEVAFPASLDNVIAVGAVDGRKRKTDYSNFGSALDVVAPGGRLDRDDDGDGFPDGVLQQTFDPETAAVLGRYDDFAYFFVVGTSQATPHVAAVAALLVRQGITNPAAVKAAIESTAEDLGTSGRDDTFGHGLIRPVEALTGLGLNQ